MLIYVFKDPTIVVKFERNLGPPQNARTENIITFLQIRGFINTENCLQFQ